MVIRTLAILCMLAGAAQSAFAHGDKLDANAQTTARKEQKAFGIAGDRKRVSRTITMGMSDEMRFHPVALEVKRAIERAESVIELMKKARKDNAGKQHPFVEKVVAREIEDQRKAISDLKKLLP